jgi:DNA-binding NarL/FixJ family response regulator
MRTTVSVVCDDPLVLAGAAGRLAEAPDLQVVPWADRLPAQVLVVVADELDDRQLRRVASARSAGARVVAVLEDVPGSTVMASVEAGVSVIVRRAEVTGPGLTHAVRVAAAGDGAMPADLLRRLLGQAASGRHPKSLTPREIRVILLLADGYSTAEIARTLAYSESTIKSSIHQLTSRLELRNRSHAVAFALRAGLI